MSNDGVNHARRRFLTVATTGVGVAGAGFVVTPFVGSWNPSAKAKSAGAPVKANISKISLSTSCEERLIWWLVWPA